jgi:hypothetical protein
MDAIRRAKLDALIPILEAAHKVVVDVSDDEQSAHDTTPPNLKQAWPNSADMLHYLKQAEEALDHAINCTKYASGAEQLPSIPIALDKSIRRRI